MKNLLKASYIKSNIYLKKNQREIIKDLYEKKIADVQIFKITLGIIINLNS